MNRLLGRSRLSRSAVGAHVAARLRELGTAPGLTQQGIADLLGVTSPANAQIREQNRPNPR